MRTLNFDELNIHEKASLLFAFGVYMASVIRAGYLVTLFALDSTFVEVWYNKHSHQIDWISTVRYTDLDKYLDDIRIP